MKIVLTLNEAKNLSVEDFSEIIKQLQDYTTMVGLTLPTTTMFTRWWSILILTLMFLTIIKL